MAHKFNDIRLSVRKTVELSDHSTRNADLLSNDLLTYIQKKELKTKHDEKKDSVAPQSQILAFAAFPLKKYFMANAKILLI